MIPYKRFDLLVETFNKNGLPLIIITNTVNKLMQELQTKSASNIRWEINISDSEKIQYIREAKAFMFPQEEDFGMVPIEAMLCGTPVIAFGRGGALETVKDGISGVFFSTQNSENIIEAVQRFESLSFTSENVRAVALKFTRVNFQNKIRSYITKEFEKL